MVNRESYPCRKRTERLPRRHLAAGARALAFAGLITLMWASSAPNAHARPAIDVLWSALDRTEKDSPAAGDLDAIAREVGADAKAIVAWMQANVRWEPYDGVLRGARGTAMARAGNAVDQALLLQALLARAGKQATLMTRALTAEEGKTLLAGFLASDRMRLLSDVGRADAADLVLIGISPADLAASQALDKADEAAVAEALDAAARMAPRLASALDKLLKPRRLAAPRQHAWVELDGLALDPIAAALPHEGGKLLDARALERLRHSLVLSLVVQRTRAGKAEEEVLLRVTAPLDEVAFAPIELSIRPDPASLGVGPDARKDPKSLIAKLSKVDIMRADLLIGDKRHGAAAFDRKGARHEVGDDGSAQGPAGLGQSLGGVFGGFGGGRPAKTDPTVLTGVVMRVEVKGPGEGDNPERVHERTLISARLGDLPVVRMSLLADHLVLAPGERERSTLRSLRQMRPAVDALIAGKSDVAEKVVPPGEPVGMLMRYADLRRRVQARLMGDSQAVHLRERTGLVAMIDRLAAADGRLVVQRRFDIIANAIAFVGKDALLDAKLALAQGVADTALEAALLGPSSEVARKGTAWALLGGASGELKAEKLKGLVRVAQGPEAWWSVDPKSGTVVGRVSGGGGQAMVEYAYQVAKTACEWSWPLAWYAASRRDNDYHVQDVNTWVSRFCSVVTGTEMQQLMSEHIGEVTNGLWDIAIPALRGVPHPKK